MVRFDAASMGDYRNKPCRVCGRTRDQVGSISWRGLCPEHSVSRVEENNAQISAGAGPFAAHRLRRSLMAAQRALVALERGEA